MSLKYNDSWRNSDNIWKRRLASYRGKLLAYVYYLPLNNLGKIRALVKKYGFVEIELKDHRGVYENMGFVRDNLTKI